MCKHNDDVNFSPYLRRRLRSYDEAIPEKNAKINGKSTTEENANNKTCDICECDYRGNSEA